MVCRKSRQQARQDEISHLRRLEGVWARKLKSQQNQFILCCLFYCRQTCNEQTPKHINSTRQKKINVGEIMLYKYVSGGLICVGKEFMGEVVQISSNIACSAK